jgi:hypothetical protein
MVELALLTEAGSSSAFVDAAEVQHLGWLLVVLPAEDGRRRRPPAGPTLSS